ncbi:hypothetical protein AMATHDRAFT_71076 [Amanita thiersii Skay4041]|uniref:FAD/NAD(P)-binding domain-containing protein n=1 Tax=Amanita thiersii Skay4041 TaxID=703135 RepID=A0A2A9N804_9AGAR|nr:hypothetical protein AMATHDRAFT_71076 [Amanita thiersii Skay4041]
MPITHPSESVLPVLDKLNATVPANADAEQIRDTWFSTFKSSLESNNIPALLNIIVPDGAFWRDILAFTWDFRTFEGQSKISKFLTDRLASANVTNVKLKTPSYTELQKPYPDLVWVQFLFEFETDIGLCSGVVRLVPQSDNVWRAHMLFTNLDDLKNFPEQIGLYRPEGLLRANWAEKRIRDSEYKDKNPTVLIIGGGHCGLDVAARLRYQDIDALIIEKNERIGDNWRKRYEALSLHDQVWLDHLPYLPFPPTWPVYAPAQKLGNWLENYADVMELDYWTSTTVLKAVQLPNDLWEVTVRKASGEERVFTVKHVVFALGFKGGEPFIPKYPGMDKFKGQILHSLQHKVATDHAGKKVVVVGSCTSAHDICEDYVNHGVDVTMFQRSSTYIMSTKHGMRILMEGLYEETGSPPTHIADLINLSLTNNFMLGYAYRQRIRISEADKETLDGLKRVGFKLNDGYKDAGFYLLAWTRAGGYYLDTGASQLIIDGKIKLKNDSQIKEFTETGLLFENGTELPADVVLFSTGLGEPRDGVRRICGDEIADKCTPIWGLDEEGEFNGVWKEIGIKNLWYMMGSLGQGRFHSKHVALQIKAKEEGIFGTRYSLARTA